jgi:hypothetical protein
MGLNWNRLFYLGSQCRHWVTMDDFNQRASSPAALFFEHWLGVMVVTLAALTRAEVAARAVQAQAWAKAALTSSRSEEQAAVKGEQRPVAVRMARVTPRLCGRPLSAASDREAVTLP